MTDAQREQLDAGFDKWALEYGVNDSSRADARVAYAAGAADARAEENEFVKHLKTAHNIMPVADGRECNVCRFERDSGIVRDPHNGWAIRND